MGQKILKINADLFRHLLRLPEGCRVVAVSNDCFFDETAFAVKVESSEFPDVRSGCVIPATGPLLTFDQQGNRWFTGWDLAHKGTAAEFKATTGDPLGWVRETPVTKVAGIDFGTEPLGAYVFDAPGTPHDRKAVDPPPLVVKRGREFI